ncbi:tyrosine-protein kinase csk-1-like [Saccostrea cucullata]|uniref:tyrosine-protein kinase csk-1-like n=1 Tax=Saccostrea cuccullata TaxID=36930 RepID=UPI002ED684A5
MKKGYTSTDKVLMHAKIDFNLFVGIHENILRFVGAVLNDKIRGPYIVLEYCNKGQLDIWLKYERINADGRTLNKLCKIANGICDGMIFLEEKEVVHQRLGTRNVLLNESFGHGLIPKIYGFCPTPNTDTDGKKLVVLSVFPMGVDHEVELVDPRKYPVDRPQYKSSANLAITPSWTKSPKTLQVSSSKMVSEPGIPIAERA